MKALAFALALLSAILIACSPSSALGSIFNVHVVDQDGFGVRDATILVTNSTVNGSVSATTDWQGYTPASTPSALPSDVAVNVTITLTRSGYETKTSEVLIPAYGGNTVELIMNRIDTISIPTSIVSTTIFSFLAALFVAILVRRSSL